MLLTIKIAAIRQFLALCQFNLIKLMLCLILKGGEVYPSIQSLQLTGFNRLYFGMKFSLKDGEV